VWGQSGRWQMLVFGSTVFFKFLTWISVSFAVQQS
jgi:hypothetical protein